MFGSDEGLTYLAFYVHGSECLLIYSMDLLIGHSGNFGKNEHQRFSDLISGIVWVTSVSYNWSMVSKATVNQL